VLVCLFAKAMCGGKPAGMRRRLRVLGSCCTRSPVVTISSPMEDRDEDDGWEEISTQDSIARGCKQRVGEDG
jgi:hypothetical protein